MAVTIASVVAAAAVLAAKSRRQAISKGRLTLADLERPRQVLEPELVRSDRQGKFRLLAGRKARQVRARPEKPQPARRAVPGDHRRKRAIKRKVRRVRERLEKPRPVARMVPVDHRHKRAISHKARRARVRLEKLRPVARMVPVDHRRKQAIKRKARRA